MFYRIRTDLDKEEIVNKFSKSKMVHLDEWDVNTSSVFREEIINYQELDKETLDLIDNYWLGIKLAELQLTIQYEVYLNNGVLEICFLDYNTYVEGFMGIISFDVKYYNKAVEGILEEWENELEGSIISVDIEEY